MCLNTRVRPCVRHVSDMTRNIHSTCPTRMGVQPQHGPGRDIPAGVDACELPPAGWAGSPHAMCAVCQWAGLRLVAAGGTLRLVALWWHSRILLGSMVPVSYDMACSRVLPPRRALGGSVCGPPGESSRSSGCVSPPPVAASAPPSGRRSRASPGDGMGRFDLRIRSPGGHGGFREDPTTLVHLEQVLRTSA
jgi:hypothetical protein